MPPERTAQTYGPGVTAASQAVLLELMAVLRAYRDALVLVGGWVPYILLQRGRRAGDPFVHVGSIDIDLAVDPAKIDEAGYATIAELLESRGYRPAESRRGRAIPNSFERTANSPLTRKPYLIRIDFLTPQGAADASNRYAPLQDALLARKVKGCEAAFRYQTTITLEGTLPEGGTLSVPLRMADLVGSLTMKGIVLGERYREKDAYDVYAMLAHLDGGPRRAAEAVRPHLGDPLVQEGLQGIRSAFASREANGPAWVAAFLGSPLLAVDYQRLVTEAFMVVNEFLTACDATSAHAS
jgi:hypothetical protein